MSPARRRHPWLALLLSVLFPGLGVVYAGAILRGSALMVAAAAFAGGACFYLVSPDFGLGLFWLYFYLQGAVTLFSWVDSFLTARRRNRQSGAERPRGKDAWLAAFLSVLIPGLGHLYCGKYGLAVLFFLLWFPLNLPGYFMKWLFPVLPVYTVLVAVNAHSACPQRGAQRRGMRLFVAAALVILILQAAFLTFQGQYLLDMFRAKAAVPLPLRW